MKDLRWTHVVVVLGTLGVLGWLAYQGKDGATVITGMLALLAALGFVAYQQSEIKSHTEAIKQNTNGNISRMLTMLEKQGEMLAEMQRPQQSEAREPVSD